jgi:hypothetical protein
MSEKKTSYRCICETDHSPVAIHKRQLYAGAIAIAILLGVGAAVSAGVIIVTILGGLFLATAVYYLIRKHSLVCALRIAAIQVAEGIGSPIPS